MYLWVAILTVWRRSGILNGGLVDGWVDQEILAEIFEVAVYAGSAPHGCNAKRQLQSGKDTMWRIRCSRDSPV